MKTFYRNVTGIDPAVSLSCYGTDNLERACDNPDYHVCMIPVVEEPETQESTETQETVETQDSESTET